MQAISDITCREINAVSEDIGLTNPHTHLYRAQLLWTMLFLPVCILCCCSMLLYKNVPPSSPLTRAVSATEVVPAMLDDLEDSTNSAGANAGAEGCSNDEASHDAMGSDGVHDPLDAIPKFMVNTEGRHHHGPTFSLVKIQSGSDLGYSGIARSRSQTSFDFDQTCAYSRESWSGGEDGDARVESWILPPDLVLLRPLDQGASHKSHPGKIKVSHPGKIKVSKCSRVRTRVSQGPFFCALTHLLHTSEYAHPDATSIYCKLAHIPIHLHHRGWIQCWL